MAEQLPTLLLELATRPAHIGFKIMFDIKINVDNVEDVVRDFKKIGIDIIPEAEHFALVDVARKYRTQAVRTVAEELGVKKGAIRKRVTFKRPKRRVPKSVHFSTSYRLLLTEFRHRVRDGRGVSVKIGASTQEFPHAFKARGAVYQRSDLRTGAYDPEVSRLPISRVGIDIFPVVKRVAPKALRRMNIDKELQLAMQRQVKFRTARAALKHAGLL